MVEFHYKLLFSSGVIGIISIFTPVIFHISTYSVYQFWVWGFAISFGINSIEIGITYNSAADFLIPGFVFLIPVILSSLLILNTSLKARRMEEKLVRLYILGGILMLISPLLLMITWQIIYVFMMDYPTFWGENYFWPSIAIFLQLIAGILATFASIKIRWVYLS